MFGLPSRHGRNHADPLQTRRMAVEWFRDLPALDVIGRQARVVGALAGMKHARPGLDLDRVAAILYLDAAMAVDRRRLVKWYFENLRGSARLADRFWDAALEVGDAFIVAYEAALDAALARADDGRWMACLPRFIARLIHLHGAEAALRLLRGERVPPQGWRRLHALFLLAAEHRCERSIPSLPGEDSRAIHGTVEHEYVHVLLLDRLTTGNLAPAELDWASTKLHGWSRGLALESRPRAAAGFYVDLAGNAGLARLNGAADGAKVGYLDTTPLAAELDRAIQALGAPDPDGSTRPDWVKRQRIATLEKIRPAVSPSRPEDLRRHVRRPADLPVDVRIGLAQITRELATPDAPRAARAAAHRLPLRTRARPAAPPLAIGHRTSNDVEEIEIPPLPGDAWSRDPVIDAVPAQRSADSRPPWRLLDRSDAGWQITAPDGAGQGLALGALIAVSSADDEDWVLGFVTRLARGARDGVVAGMALIASQIVPVKLYGRRKAQPEMSVFVDGVDAASIGARFDGLYLMPPSRLDTRLAARTLIVPASEHFEGRHVILSTARADYTVTLGKVIDQRTDWSWVTIRVSGKAPRAS